jgi:periplasmic protein TonB
VRPMARVGGVAVSLIAHAAIGALLLALSETDWSRPLFVDLVQRAESPGAPAAPTPVTPGPATRSRERAIAAAPPRPGPRSAPPAPAAATAEPAPPAPPAPADRAAPSEAAPPAVPLAVGPAPAEPSRPDVVDPPSPPASAPPASITPPAPVAAGRGGAPEGAGGARATGETRGDASSSLGGAPGSVLALGSPGTGAIPAEYGPYLRRFRQRVQESLVYPLAARRQGLRGTVELDVRLDSAGRVRDVRVARSSSHELLDDAAVETIRRLGPLPFPESLPRRSLLIRLPLVFDLR